MSIYCLFNRGCDMPQGYLAARFYMAAGFWFAARHSPRVLVFISEDPAGLPLQIHIIS